MNDFNLKDSVTSASTPKDSSADQLVINRSVTLRDTWAKMQKKRLAIIYERANKHSRIPSHCVAMYRLTLQLAYTSDCWPLANQEGRNFGGVGLMLKKPRIKVKVKASDSFQTTGIFAERLAEFAEMWKAYTKADSLPNCTLKVTNAPPQHVGLGLGTQLGLSTAEALQRFAMQTGFSAMERAIVVNRAARSAVGTYGFEFGGLIVERGRLPNERISPLECRMEISQEMENRLNPSGTGERSFRRI